ncbi:MAG: hypothetical protein KGD57_06030 [Candidatus Lokiarchaeota archaeon]|nr:hypothetical protein [Candidatus Lokiarchaeota archaeon]
MRKRTKGIICLILGAYFCIGTSLIPLFNIKDGNIASFIAIYIIIFWILALIIPGILLLKDYKFSNRFLLYFIIPLTLIYMGIYIAIILEGQPTYTEFWDKFIHFLAIGLFVSILLSLVTIFVFYLKYFSKGWRWSF